MNRFKYNYVFFTKIKNVFIFKRKLAHGSPHGSPIEMNRIKSNREKFEKNCISTFLDNIFITTPRRKFLDGNNKMKKMSVNLLINE